MFENQKDILAVEMLEYLSRQKTKENLTHENAYYKFV